MFNILRNRALVSNIISLSVLNALNLALPLVSLPYLIATIGSAYYGAYSISYTILQYVLLIGSYGFGCTATKVIAQSRDDINFVSKVFFSTIGARLLLTIGASTFFYIIVLLVFPQYNLLYLFGLGIVFGDILNPVWLFQGMENMKYMTIVNATAKITFTILIFLFITTPDDYIYITLLNSAGFLLAGLFSFVLAIKKFGIKYVKISFTDVIDQIKDSSVVFFSSAFVNLYNNSFVFMLGLFLSESSIGIYAAAEKLIKAVKSVVEPISTALFPHVAKSFVGKKNSENVQVLFRYTKSLLIPLVILSVSLFFLAPIICQIFLKSIASESIMLIRFMSPLVTIGGLNYMLGVVGLINLGLQKTWFRILAYSSLLALVTLLIGVQFLDYYSAVLASTVAEITILILAFLKLRKISL